VTDEPGRPPAPAASGPEPDPSSAAASRAIGRTTPGIDLPGPRSVREAWCRAGVPGRVGLAIASVVALCLLGAFLFGLWHVLFGGLLKGNWRAGGFGIALTSAAGVLLWIDAIVLRRLGARVG
jgi:hypothetical protein